MRILAVDIGGTYMKYALMDENRTILSSGKVSTPKERNAEIEAIGSLVDSVCPVDGIAVSMPGIIDSENGVCIFGGGAMRCNDGFEMKKALQERCGNVKVTMENDAKCAAAAEAAFGSLKDVPDGFVITFGTMIGGAFVKDRKVLHGKHFSAGEVSYLITDRDTPPVPETVWGNRCGVPELCRMYASLKGISSADVTGQTVFEAFDLGDDCAASALKYFTRQIAVQIINIQMLLDPCRFSIGGGISARGELIGMIRERIEELYSETPYFLPRPEIVRCEFGNDANLFGALSCFLENA